VKAALYFSDQPLPQHDMVLEWMREENLGVGLALLEGNWRLD
jgi:hypothetical protein